MFVVNGVNMFPAQINDILKKATGVEPRFQIVIDNLVGEDVMEVRVEVVENMFNDEIKKVLALKNGIAGEHRARAGSKDPVTLVEQDSPCRGAGRQGEDRWSTTGSAATVRGARSSVRRRS